MSKTRKTWPDSAAAGPPIGYTKTVIFWRPVADSTSSSRLSIRASPPGSRVDPTTDRSGLLEDVVFTHGGKSLGLSELSDL